MLEQHRPRRLRDRLLDAPEPLTVAEGIEREDQRALLLELGCDLGQCHLMNRPLPAAAASELIVGLL